MQNASAEVQKMFAEIWGSMQREGMERKERAAKADPKAHKLTTIFKNSNYRYVYGGYNGKNQLVLYCWSSHRNVAGYFLGWRETQRRNKTGKRDQWAARKSRKTVMELAQRRAKRFQGKAAAK